MARQSRAGPNRFERSCHRHGHRHSDLLCRQVCAPFVQGMLHLRPSFYSKTAARNAVEQVVEKEVERQVAQLRQQDAMHWPPRRLSREQPSQHFAKDIGFGAASSHDFGPVWA